MSSPSTPTEPNVPKPGITKPPIPPKPDPFLAMGILDLIPPLWLFLRSSLYLVIALGFTIFGLPSFAQIVLVLSFMSILGYIFAIMCRIMAAHIKKRFGTWRDKRHSNTDPNDLPE